MELSRSYRSLSQHSASRTSSGAVENILHIIPSVSALLGLCEVMMSHSLHLQRRHLLRLLVEKYTKRIGSRGPRFSSVQSRAARSAVGHHASCVVCRSCVSKNSQAQNWSKGEELNIIVGRLSLLSKPKAQFVKGLPILALHLLHRQLPNMWLCQNLGSSVPFTSEKRNSILRFPI